MSVRGHEPAVAEACVRDGCAAVLLDDVRYRLQLYLIALWGRDFAIEPLSDDATSPLTQRPCLRGDTIHLPSRIEAGEEVSAMAHYRAAAVHAAAHAIYSHAFDAQDLKPRQRLLVELIEDARVEYLAIQRFPRLRYLWASLLPPKPSTTMPFPALIWQLSKALLAPEAAYRGDFWIDKGVGLFLERRARMEDPTISREIGLRLAHDLGQMRLAMDEGGTLPLLASYRDDNRHLWLQVRETLSEDAQNAAECMPASRPEAFLEEATEGRRVAFSEIALTGEGGDAGYRVEVTSDDASLSFYQSTAPCPEPNRMRYPEWFEDLGFERQNWCTVREQSAPTLDTVEAERALGERQVLLRRLRNVMGALRMRRIVRLRAQESGDDLDLDAAIRVLAEWRTGRVPDAYVYQRRRIQNDPSLNTSLLLDLSESVNTPVSAVGRRVLDLAREAVLLLGQTVDGLGHPLAVAGFRSNGRHEIDYLRVKGFDEGFDAEARGRLYGLTGGGSTRMGAAIRHATASLAAETGSHRLLLVVTDGVPADIDVFNPDHLVSDARHAVMQARRQGVQVFCVSLDPQADVYVSRIFGLAHYLVLDQVEYLPERLTRLFLKFASTA